MYLGAFPGVPREMSPKCTENVRGASRGHPQRGSPLLLSYKALKGSKYAFKMSPKCLEDILGTCFGHFKRRGGVPATRLGHFPDILKTFRAARPETRPNTFLRHFKVILQFLGIWRPSPLASLGCVTVTITLCLWMAKSIPPPPQGKEHLERPWGSTFTFSR